MFQRYLVIYMGDILRFAINTQKGRNGSSIVKLSRLLIEILIEKIAKKMLTLFIILYKYDMHVPSFRLILRVFDLIFCGQNRSKTSFLYPINPKEEGRRFVQDL